MRAYVSTTRIPTLVVLCAVLVIAAGLQRVGHTDASATDDACRRAEQAGSLDTFWRQAVLFHEGGAFVYGGGDEPPRLSLSLSLEPGCYIAVRDTFGTDEDEADVDETMPVEFPVSISCSYRSAETVGACGSDEIVILRSEVIEGQDGVSVALLHVTPPDAIYYFRFLGTGKIDIAKIE